MVLLGHLGHQAQPVDLELRRNCVLAMLEAEAERADWKSRTRRRMEELELKAKVQGKVMAQWDESEDGGPGT